MFYKMVTEPEVINREYVRILQSRFMWPFQVTGVRRFETKYSKLVDKSQRSVLRGTLTLLIWNLCGIYVIYDTTVSRSNYLLLSEFLVLLQFFLGQNSISLNVMFCNRKSGLKLIKTCMHLDVIFGVEDTKFMRKTPQTMYVIMTTGVMIIIASIAFGVIFSHEIFFSILITETTFIVLLYLMFDDYMLLLVLLTFLTMRIRYLNISLIKMVNVERKIFPNHLLFDALFWKVKHEDLVKFHEKANIKHYEEAVTYIYKLFRQVASGFRFCLFIGLIICVSGLFIMVEWITDYIKSDMSNIRTGAVTAWILVAWLYMYILAIQVEIVRRQIDETKLICIYIYLKHDLPNELIELVESILHILATQEFKISIYGMFHFNMDLIVKIFVSIIVYVIMQLQLSLAPSHTSLVSQNVTESLPFYLV